MPSNTTGTDGNRGASKVCTVCKTDKHLNSFHSNGNPKRTYSHCKDCHNAYQRRYWQKIKDNKQIKDRRRQNVRRWQIANPDKVARNYARRRLKTKFAVPQRWLKSSCPDYLCYWCGEHIDETTRHLEHIMPICLGGPATPDNEVWACKKCNLAKNRKHPLLWIALQFSSQVNSK